MDPQDNGKPSDGTPVEQVESIESKVERALALVEKHEHRISDLGRGVAKVLQRTKVATAPEDEGEPKSAEAPKSATQDDAYRLGQLVAKLPEHASTWIEERRAAGMDYSRALDAVEAMQVAIKKNSPAATEGAQGTVESNSRMAPPPGTFATSAPRNSPAHPRSLGEFTQLASTDRARFEALKADPTFDPMSLPTEVA